MTEAPKASSGPQYNKCHGGAVVKVMEGHEGRRAPLGASLTLHSALAKALHLSEPQFPLCKMRIIIPLLGRGGGGSKT